MSEYHERARDLATKMLSSLEAQTYKNAKRVFLADKSAQKLLNDYNAYQKKLRIDINNNKLSEEEVKEATLKLQAMFKELKKDSVVGPLIFAETQYNELITGVMNIFKATLTEGKDENQNNCEGCNKSD